ncbi:Carboxylesterase family-domain-containing protein [Aspergillus coremiiformis]|uniref:Carboxylesterase family-domain-containing protein n=1 Tax=Aspergillus coremiiformis TaxID=138285 RepID=A0A5N6Z1N0_9EURO|nr:Carboxylesterase family-domain-containing protein [Aspergillus coremiiformis]
MRIQTLANFLLFCGPALAAPTATDPPSTSSLGTLRVLKYNNLGPENSGMAAVLAYDELSKSEAQARCATIGENLYPLESAAQTDRSELDYQLAYLVYSGDIQSNSSFWISTNNSSSPCRAYSQSRKMVVSEPCSSKLRAICTSSVPPTTDNNRNVADKSKVVVTAENYTLTGYRDARSFRFLGIPFADPPVKELRFAPPVAFSGPKERDATTLSDGCIQVQSASGPGGDGAISEDCLYLNIYTPILPAESNHNSTPKPVAVYFYGGAFLGGSASLIDYDGGNFASRNDVVIVTVNYRVGALGWLTTGNLTTGNYGTRDQILALKWVNKHIAAFGGDPSRITIFGQSAGGQSVVALQSSTAARGLFSAAIAQSAPVDTPWYTRDIYSNVIVPQVAKAVGCNQTSSETALVSCLRSVPATKFLDNTTEFKNAFAVWGNALASDYLHTSPLLVAIEPLMPIVDSRAGVIDDQFYKLLADERLPNRVPTMFTTVTDEASFYVAQFVPSLGASQDALNLLINTTLPPKLAESVIRANVFLVNATDPDSTRNVAADALTHKQWSCAQSYLLRKGGQRVFPQLYEVEITQGHVQTNVGVPEVCSPNNVYNASCHSADVLPVWGTLNSKTKTVAPYYNQDDILHSQLLNDVWASFFHSHNPNPDQALLKLRGPAYASTYNIFVQNGYQVPEYRPEAPEVSLLGMPPSWIGNPGLSRKCAVFEDYGFTFQNANLTASS